MVRSVLALGLLLALPACDSADPEEERTTGQQSVEIDGYQLYGVDATEESDGTIIYRLSDEITNVFRFGALPSLSVADPCPDDVDVCSSIVLNRPTDVEVTLDRPVVVEGETLDAGTDLADFLSTPDRDYLLEIPPAVPDTPNPSNFVTLDSGVIQIPDGEVRVTVRWTTNTPSISYTATTAVTFTR